MSIISPVRGSKHPPGVQKPDRRGSSSQGRLGSRFRGRWGLRTRKCEFVVAGKLRNKAVAVAIKALEIGGALNAVVDRKAGQGAAGALCKKRKHPRLSVFLLEETATYDLRLEGRSVDRGEIFLAGAVDDRTLLVAKERRIQVLRHPRPPEIIEARPA